jgi:hypothetical protein
MPIDPVGPASSAAIDRLNLGVTSARGSGTEPSFPAPGMCACFDAETSTAYACAIVNGSLCFEAE